VRPQPAASLLPPRPRLESRLTTLLTSQAEPATTHNATATDPRQPRRSLFVDEMNDPALTNHAWPTADNDTPNCNDIDEVEIDVNSHARPQEGVAPLTSRSGTRTRKSSACRHATNRFHQALARPYANRKLLSL